MSTFRYRLRANNDRICVEDYRRAAKRALPSFAWAYLDSGADGLRTLKENRAAFGRWFLQPRVLAGFDKRELGVTIAGTDLALPVVLAPTGLTGVMHWEGELGAARAAEKCGTRMVLSTAATYSLEEVAAGTEQDHWFQLYPWRDRTFIESMIERACEAGFSAMFVTVDVPVLGNRIEERRTGMGIPPTVTPRTAVDVALHPRWAYGLFRHGRITMRNLTGEKGLANSVESAKIHTRLMRPDLNWDDFSWMRSLWPGPLYIKGVLNADDAARAVDLGADGVVVSNHGGRQLDGVRATIDVLPEISDRVRGQAQVLVDGGISNGGDVVKALCLGADACLIGRSFVYGLAAEGPQGVSRVLKILRVEIDRALTLMGCASVKDLDPSWVVRSTG
jgi:isopentenyl diphosphate isomerase/L-lactate dehydrogenase-like FMN-dependent dehydrogenase